jgi:signal transduction histidine kinase
MVFVSFPLAGVWSTIPCFSISGGYSAPRYATLRCNISNAIKYTPDGGRITVSGRCLVDAHTGPQEGAVEIVVADTGIGIDPAMHDLVFAKFYQTGAVSLHSTGKANFKGGGPGLGLAIARGIVEAHGGRIWVESPGCDEEKCPGSQFHVVLPIIQKVESGFSDP